MPDHSVNDVENTPLLQAAHKPHSRPGPREITRATRYGILAGIWTANFLSSLNMTLVATLLPTISSEFNQANQASWLGTSYLLATSTFTPLYGRLCDILGRRGANQSAVVFTAVGTLACGLSGSMEMLIVARFLAGLGGGGINTTAKIVTSDLFSLKSRGLVQGIATFWSALGMGLGGPLGGFISDRFGWRYAFLCQLPLFAISFALTSINLGYATPGRSKRTMDVLKRIDYGGTMTLLGAVLSFLIFLSNRYNKGLETLDVAVIMPLVLSVLFLGLFVAFELRFAPAPMLAPSLLVQKIPVCIGLSNLLVAQCNFAITYHFPLFFITVALTGASTAGLHLVPNSVATTTGSLFAGWVMHKTGHYKKLTSIFGIFPFIAGILLVRMTPESNTFVQWFSIIPLGFGNSIVLQTMMIALLANLPESEMAVGTGFGELFRGLGQVSGVGVSSAIFQNYLVKELQRRITGPEADSVIDRIRHSATLVASLPSDIKDQATASYEIAIRAVFIMAAASTLLAYMIRLLIPDRDLNDLSRRRAEEPRAAAASPSAAAAGVAPTPSLSDADSPESDADEAADRVSQRSVDIHPRVSARPTPRKIRRLSGYESMESSI
ncbi:MFS general substrate transporter [Peniophora sp. CONT]|nr:MFS general substrate transporter [Peniophora sp. CONT]